MIKRSVAGFEISTDPESGKVLVALLKRRKIHTFALTQQQANDMVVLLDSAIDELSTAPGVEAR